MLRMVMVRLFFLLCWWVGLATVTGCSNSATVGLDFTLPLTFKVVPTTHRLTWKRGDTSIFIKKNGRITLGKETDTNGDGSLLLTNVGKDNAGTYIVEVNDMNTGKLVYKKEYTLCVYDDVPVPTVTMKCTSEYVTFICNVSKADRLTFKWHIDGKEEKDKTVNLTMKKKLFTNKNIKCTVSNEATSKSSQLNEFCPGLLLLLIIAIGYCVHGRIRKSRRHEVEAELRLNLAGVQVDDHHHHHPHHHPPQQEKQQHGPNDQAGKKKLRPRTSKSQERPDRSRHLETPETPAGNPRPSPRGRAPPKPAQDDDDIPPPLPQPRKKKDPTKTRRPRQAPPSHP